MRPISRNTTVIIGSGLVLAAAILFQAHLIKSMFLNRMAAVHDQFDRFENRIGGPLDEVGSTLDKSDGVFDKLDGLMEQLDVIDAKAGDLVVRFARIEGFLHGLAKQGAFPRNRDVPPATPIPPQD